MSAWWLISLLVVLVLISTVNSKFDLDTPIRLARCRATCLYKMKTAADTDTKCKQSLFCSQCWRSCGILQTITTALLHCRSKECGPGCLEACRFHPPSSRYVSPVPLEEVLVVNDSRVSWPPVSGPVVYVVMAAGSQLCQTLELSVTLLSAVDLDTVRVLVVAWRGLVKVLAPVAEPPIGQTLQILRSLGIDHKVSQASQTVFDNDVTTLEESINQITVDNSWNVNLLSLHYQQSLVLAQIGWQSYHNQLIRNNQLNISYLVSWAAEGDVVRGNLLTNTSMATLSLWPDTTYRIQVALFSLATPAIQSEPMTLDTHLELAAVNTTSSKLSTTTSRLPDSQVHVGQPLDGTHLYTDAYTEGRHGLSERVGGGAGTEVVAGVSSAVLVFLGIVLTATWRWRHRLYLPHNKLLDEESDAPNLYRIFPPAMRLLGDADVFSSRDNLLQHQ